MIRVSARTMLLGAALALCALTVSALTARAAKAETLQHRSHVAYTRTSYHSYHTYHSYHAYHSYHHVAQYTARHFTSSVHHVAYHHVAYHHVAYHHVAYVEHRHVAYPYHRYIHNTAYYPRAAEFRRSSLQCVPYAREISHIDITGNAYLWWAEAAGRYARGNMPQQGAVLNFRAIGRMPLGHVAVVTGIINSRTILVTQANWVPGTITNDVTIQDVSPNNNWTLVRVELGDSSRWGAPYPTYGFIYDHPAIGTVIAANGQSTEVAEAPAQPGVSNGAPNRNLQ